MSFVKVLSSSCRTEIAVVWNAEFPNVLALSLHDPSEIAKGLACYGKSYLLGSRDDAVAPVSTKESQGGSEHVVAGPFLGQEILMNMRSVFLQCLNGLGPVPHPHRYNELQLALEINAISIFHSNSCPLLHAFLTCTHLDISGHKEGQEFLHLSSNSTLIGPCVCLIRRSWHLFLMETRVIQWTDSMASNL